MSASKVNVAPSLTFVSSTGPKLDDVNAKAMRAHTTKANFARRRRRLVQEYADQQECTARIEPPRAIQAGQTAVFDQVVDTQLRIFRQPSLDRKLNGRDAFFIKHLTQAMEKLHLVADVPISDTALAVMQSDWAPFLPDTTMLDVSLYWGRHYYAARLQRHAVHLVADAYKGRAIRSVRENLISGSNSPSDSLIAAILILTVLEQTSDNIEAWKVHISGLIQVVTLRSRDSDNPPTHWASQIIPRTTMQGLLLFTRHDATLLPTIEKTGIFDTMFSAPAKRVAYRILENANEVTALRYHDTSDRNKPLPPSEQSRIRRIIKSLDTAIQLNSTVHTSAAFLTGLALTIKIFLEIVLRHNTTPAPEEEPSSTTAVQLVDILQNHQQQTCSSLALCSFLESRFWQTMMGAIAAPDARTRSFCTSRLGPITAALTLTTWRDAEAILRRFFWIPSIFSPPGYEILSEVLGEQGYTDM